MKNLAFQLAYAAACCFVALGLSAAAADGAEMRVRAECAPQQPIVALGDLVDLRCESTNEAERLAKITLFPAPAAGLRRFVSAREIQDMLLIRGINLIDHQFTGAATVLVVGRPVQQHGSVRRRLASASPRGAEQRLQKAILAHLTGLADEPWQVEFSLEENTARWISVAESLSIAGARQPETGRQSFQITLRVGETDKIVDVIAEVKLPPQVVVPVRSIPRHTRISAADLELKRLERTTTTTAHACRLENLVGKETTRALPVGKPIDRASVREPVVVHRGDVVSVVVRAAGILVRTQARVRDDGAVGDLVAVESLTDRKSYFAQVSGVREVEVFATGVSSGVNSMTNSSR